MKICAHEFLEGQINRDLTFCQQGLLIFKNSRKSDDLVKSSNSTSEFPRNHRLTSTIKLSIRNHFPSVSSLFDIVYRPFLVLSNLFLVLLTPMSALLTSFLAWFGTSDIVFRPYLAPPTFFWPNMHYFKLLCYRFSPILVLLT